MKKKTDPIEEIDFGFSFVDEPPEDEMTAEERLQLMYDTIIPLLENLSKNPEKKNIHWPNRAEKIEGFKQKLKHILEGTMNE